ncbi:MAG: aldehyde ferredoxin oxidoreductase C-terminal domain-containing protein, partial [Anaerolineales bacterium]
SQEAVEALVHLTARKEGFGAYVAEGSKALGKRFGRETDAVQVNGLEVAYHDPRAATGMALVYATSPRGACHNQSDYFMVEVGQVETSLGLEHFSRLGGEEKALNVALHQDWRTLFNSLVLCLFANVPPSTILNLINAACGLDWDIGELMAAGERGWNLKRVINNRLGLHAEDDRLPEPLLKPHPYGSESEGNPIEFDRMLSAYYQARGWDPQTGYPTQEKLQDLGLGWVIRDL